MEDKEKNIDQTETTEEVVEEKKEQEEIPVESEEVEEETEETSADKKGFFKKKGKSAKTLEIELKKAKEETEEYKDRYQRLMAEFENARKRTAKETSKMYDGGAKDVLEKLLPVIDNFERGLAAVSEEEKESPFVQGIDKIYKQMIGVFEGIGVHPIHAEGTEFNPDLHNAVMHVEDENFGENIVVEEFQKGYMYKDTVLRYSMVKVAN